MRARNFLKIGCFRMRQFSQMWNIHFQQSIFQKFSYFLILNFASLIYLALRMWPYTLKYDYNWKLESNSLQKLFA